MKKIFEITAQVVTVIVVLAIAFFVLSPKQKKPYEVTLCEPDSTGCLVYYLDRDTVGVIIFKGAKFSHIKEGEEDEYYTSSYKGTDLLRDTVLVFPGRPHQALVWNGQEYIPARGRLTWQERELNEETREVVSSWQSWEFVTDDSTYTPVFNRYFS